MGDVGSVRYEPALLPTCPMMHWDTFKQDTVFPRLDALHVLDASAHFDAEWSGPNTF